MGLSTALWSFYFVREQGVYKHGAWSYNPVGGTSLRRSVGLGQNTHASC